MNLFKKLFIKENNEKTIDDIISSDKREMFDPVKDNLIESLNVSLHPLISYLLKNYKCSPIFNTEISHGDNDIIYDIKDQFCRQNAKLDIDENFKERENRIYKNNTQIIRTPIKFEYDPNPRNCIDKEKRYREELSRHFNRMECAIFFGDGHTYIPTDNSDNQKKFTKITGLFNMVDKIEKEKMKDLLCETKHWERPTIFYGDTFKKENKFDEVTEWNKIHANLFNHPLFDLFGFSHIAIAVDLYGLEYKYLNNRNNILSTNIQAPDVAMRIDQFLTEFTIDVEYPNRVLVFKGE